MSGQGDPRCEFLSPLSGLCLSQCSRTESDAAFVPGLFFETPSGRRLFQTAQHPQSSVRKPLRATATVGVEGSSNRLRGVSVSRSERFAGVSCSVSPTGAEAVSTGGVCTQRQTATTMSRRATAPRSNEPAFTHVGRPARFCQQGAESRGTGHWPLGNEDLPIVIEGELGEACGNRLHAAFSTRCRRTRLTHRRRSQQMNRLACW